MPAENITVKAQWNCTHPVSPLEPGKSGKSNAGAIVGGVIGGIVLIVAVVAVVLFFLVPHMKRERGNDRDAEMVEKNPRIVEKPFFDASVSIDGDSAPQTLLPGLYSAQYKAPLITEALRNVGLAEDRIRTILEACTLAGDLAESKGRLFDGFTKEDAAAVALYTFDFGGR